MNKEKYELLLCELADVIKKKNYEIALQKSTIKNLTSKLEAAEKSLKYSRTPENVEERIRG